jgi:hypothetical protein
LLVLYYRANTGGAPTLPDPEDVLLRKIQALYDGRVISAHDLEIL